MKKKVMIVFGTRPEAIKMAPLISAFEERRDEIDCVTVVTSQHRQLLDQVLELFEIRPHHDLNLMREDQTLHGVLARCLEKLTPLIDQEKPDLLVVQGDTTTTFAATIGAFYQHVPVAHVEAGLRTGNRYSPFPEEINRRLTSGMAELNFAATDTNRQNLLAESVDPQSIFVTGNTIVDALLRVRESARSGFRPEHPFAELGADEERMILVTGHRRESFGPAFRSFCTGLRKLAERNPGVEIVYPVHLNQNVQRPVSEILSGAPNVHRTRPADYKTFVYLMDRCHFIISDSGGIQEEAPSMGKPLLITRENTERPEAVESGAAKLIGTDSERLVLEAEQLLRDPVAYRAMVVDENPFGDGRSGERIVEIIAQWLKGT